MGIDGRAGEREHAGYLLVRPRPSYTFHQIAPAFCTLRQKSIIGLCVNCLYFSCDHTLLRLVCTGLGLFQQR